MITPFLNRIVVKKISELEKEEQKTATGLYLPTQAIDAEKKEQRKAIVVAVSAESEKYFKINDIVVMGKYSGIEVKDNGEEFLIVKVEDIHGFIRNE